EMTDRVAGCAQLRGQREHLVYRFQNRARVQDLGADVATDSVGGDVREPARTLIDGGRFGDRDAELVVTEAGRDVGVGGRIHFRIHSNRESGFHATARGQGIDQREL